MNYEAKIPAPFGVLGIIIDGNHLEGIDFLPQDTPLAPPENAFAKKVCGQINTYLSNPGFQFDIPLKLAGTPFQRRVWEAISKIPPGRTSQYGEISKALSSAPRAVGQACGSNPIPIVIPCHRVVSKTGPGGFMHHDEGEPLSIKRWLIEHESD